MENIEKTTILNILEVEMENVKEHEEDRRNTKDFLIFYKGYDTALKSIKRKIENL